MCVAAFHLGLKDKLDELDELIKNKMGIKEPPSTNKLIEANGHAQELIDTYGITADQYKVNDDTGLIEFNEGVLEGKQREYQEKAETATSLHNGAKIAESQQRQENSTGDLRKAVVANNEDGASFTGTNSELEKYYEAMKAAGNGTIEGFYALSEDERKAALQGVQTIYNTSGYSNQDAVNSNIAALSNDKNLAAMQQYQASNNQYANEQMSVLKGDLINSLANEDIYQNSDYKNAILNKAVDLDAYNAEKEAVEKSYVGKNKKEVASDFKDTFGEDDYIYEGKNVFKKNEDGTKGEQVSREDQIEMMASNQASESMEQAALDWANKFQNIDNSANDNEKKWLDSMLNDKGLGAFSEDQIRSLQNGEKLEIDDLFDTGTLAQLEAGGYG